MSVFLLMYLCVDASRTDCQVIPVQRWIKPDAYERCIAAVPQLTAELSTENRQRHHFVCEAHDGTELGAGQQTAPKLSYQSLRL